MAASAGGLPALATVLAGLSADFPAPILIVQHLAPHHPSLLARIFGRYTPLDVKEAVDGIRLEPGTVHVAPPDHHLLVREDGRLGLSRTNAVHFLRPAADVLFDSAAASHPNRVIAVVLTGTGRDGSMGVGAVHRRGGQVVVQDPSTAEFPGMPEAAVATGCADHVLPVAEIAPMLIRLAARLETPPP